MVTELRFPMPSWRFHIRALSVSILGVGFLVFGLVGLSSKLNPFATVGALFSTLLGAVTIVLLWFVFIYGMVTGWKRWRQLRRPTAVIDTDGIRYLAPRRPAQIPWSDVEEILLERRLLPGNTVTKASVRLLPEARLLREGLVKVPPVRYLNIGMMSDTGLPEDVAAGFLQETAGPRLKVTETDRRTPSATHGYS